MVYRRLVHWIASALAFVAVAHYLPGFKIPDVQTAVVLSLIYGVLVVLASIALLPLAYTLFIFVPRPIWKLLCLLFVNSALLVLCTRIERSFRIASMSDAMVAAVLLALLTGLFEKLLA
ncbi:MAG: phage holin family protein [Candidatus Riflebacteria bacterium]|nr:phage holin family protein [Candidatus Riflebacteria bacterium]